MVSDSLTSNFRKQRMKLESSRAELVPCACWGDHVTLRWPKCGLFMALTTACGFGALIFPYIIVVIRNLMPPFLPLISNAGGFPPSTGVFGLFLILGAFFGCIAFWLLFETINHRNRQNNYIIRKGNRIGIAVAMMTCIGFTLVACFPVGYVDVPTMFEWVTTVLYEHGIGASLILVGIANHQFALAGIWWFLPDATTRDKYTRLIFIAAYFIFFLIIVYPLPAYIMELYGPNLFDYAFFKKVSFNYPNEYSTNFLICSVCEYSLCLLSLLHYATFCRDLQRVSLRLELRPKSCWAEVESIVPELRVLP